MMTPVLLVSFSLIVLVQSQNPLANLKQWPGGFESSFTVQANQRVSGWKAHLLFDIPVYDVQVWKGSVIKRINNAQEYVIQNKSFDGDLNPGEDLIVEIQGYMVASAKFSGTYYIEGFNNTIVKPTLAVPFNGTQTKYDYKEALRLSILFYDAQRSGQLPANNPIPWRSNSHVNDRADGNDLSGGWYDSGEHVKYSLPMAETTQMLAWGFSKFLGGYEAAGLKDMMCDMIKWPLEYFLKTWIPVKHTLYVQVGDSKYQAYWGKPEYSHMPRPVYQVNNTCPGSDVAAGVAAAMAAGSYIVGNNRGCADRVLAPKLRTAAMSLYQFAKSHRGLYSNCLKGQTKIVYRSGDDRDELTLAAGWLYRLTHNNKYLSDAINFHQNGVPWSFYAGDQTIASDLLLYELTKQDKYKQQVIRFVDDWLPGGHVTQTPCGLAWKTDWGTLRYTATTFWSSHEWSLNTRLIYYDRKTNPPIANTVFLAVMAARDGLLSTVYKKWAMSQVNYMLGDNRYNMSYQIGFGDKFPVHVQHKGSTCPNHMVTCDRFHGGANYNLLKGGLVGGPDKNDTFVDDREDYNRNQVALDYNAGFQGALAGLLDLAHSGRLPAPNPRRC